MKISIIKRKLTLPVAFIAIVVWCLLGTNFAWAEEQLYTSMFVSPMSQRIILLPGEKYEGSILISNGAAATADLKYQVSIAPYNRISAEGKNEDFDTVDVDTKNQYNLITDWITIDTTSGTVRPNEQTNIHYAINVPKDAPAGAQYASILITDVTNKDEQPSNGVSLNSVPRIISGIIANVAGESIEKGVITSNSMPSFTTNNTLEATSVVQNLGNVYADAEYILQVWPLTSGEEICTNEEDPETSLVLPDVQRYHSQTCKLPIVGIFRAKQTVKIFGETSITEKTIIVCPIWLLFLIIFIVVAIIILIVVRVKSHIKSED